MKDLSKKYGRLTIKGEDVFSVFFSFSPYLAQFIVSDLPSHLCVLQESYLKSK